MSVRIQSGVFAAVVFALLVCSGARAETTSKKPSPSPTISEASSIQTPIPELAAPAAVASATVAPSSASIQSAADSAFLALQRLSRPESEETPPSSPQLFTKTQSQPMLQSIGKMLISLSFVILLALSAAWAVKKYYVKNRTLGGDYIDLLSSYALSQKSQVHLIRVGSGHYLVGEGGQSVSLISKVDLLEEAQEEYDDFSTEILEEPPQEPQDVASFDDRLTHWQDALDDRNMKQEVNASLLFLRGLSERLKSKGGGDG